MRNAGFGLFLAVATTFAATASDDTVRRLGNAAKVLDKLTDSGHGIPAGQLAGADCIAVIPGFKKGAAVVGVGYGRGFISCREGSMWSAPSAVTLESGSLGVQIGGEKMDIVIVSMDKDLRSKLLSDRFDIGADASAAWGNGKSAHDDPNAKVRFYGLTKGAFAGFGLDGATLKADESGNKALYGKTVSGREIVDGDAAAPGVAQPFIEKVTQAAR